MFSDERLVRASLSVNHPDIVIVVFIIISDQMKLTAASNKKGDFSGLNNVGVIWDNIRTKLAKRNKYKAEL